MIGSLLVPLVLLGHAQAATDPRGDGPAWAFADPHGDGGDTRVELHDVNGDGTLDVLVFDAVGSALDPDAADPGRVYVFFGGPSLSAAPDLVVGSADNADATAAPGAWGDINGDGSADQLTWVGDPIARTRTLKVRYGPFGATVPVSTTQLIDDVSTPFSYARKVPTGRIVDANGDGFGDVIMRAEDGSGDDCRAHYAVHLGSATGLSANAAWTRNIDSSGASVVRDFQFVGDVDNDGYREAVMVMHSDEPDPHQVSLTMYRGDPLTGLRTSFWTSVSLPDRVNGFDSIQMVGACDLDGDSLDDVGLLVVPADGLEPAAVRLYRGDTRYGFSLGAVPTLWSTTDRAPAPYGLGCGDANGDQRADLAMGVPAASSTLTDASGSVWVGGTLPQPLGGGQWSWDILADASERGVGTRGVAGDINGDQLMDVVVVVPGRAEVPVIAGQVQVYLGYADRDGDYADDRFDDCDPDNPLVNPAADEIWYDGIDQDCDGNDFDQDGDGFLRDEECDDTRADVSPDGVEIWYDGIDQDCDGNDVDQDEDGVDALVAGGEDCDDTDPLVSPGQIDVPDNGIDEDCDGEDATAAVADPPVGPTGCGCASSGSATGAPAGLLLLMGLAYRRRR